MTRNEYAKQIVHETAEELKKQYPQYKVFIAESGTHGFYTNKEGSRVVTFGYYLTTVPVGGCYVTDNPRECGTGWRIADDFQINQVENYFNEAAPRWAVGPNNWRYKTLAEFQKDYQSSNKYQELENVNTIPN